MLTAAKLPDPPHHRVGASDLVLTLHLVSTRFSRLHLPHTLHFEGFAITNHIHEVPVLVSLKYQPISGRDLQPHFRFLIFGFRFETERRLRRGWYRQSFEPSLRTRLRRAGKKCWRYQAL